MFNSCPYLIKIVKMIDIIIPLGKGGHKFGDIELKYALRSIEKHLTGYGDIYLVGERPEWINTNKVYCIPARDTPLRKQFSLMSKLLMACMNERISQDFIYFHDDHYLLKPLDVSEIKNWYEGNIKEHLSKAVGKYKTACENTMNALYGMYAVKPNDDGVCYDYEQIEEGKYFDIHTPCIFNKTGIRDLSHLNWKENEYIIKSLYLNINKGEDEEMEDCKINQPKSKREIEERIVGRLFFSTGHNAIKPPMIKVLDELFNEKSSYERP